jgi:hypothetical protein
MSDADVVRIRPYAIGDAGALQDAVVESLDELQPWMAWAHPGYTWDEARAWLEVQVAAFEARTEFQFAIVTAADEYLGACGLNHLDTLNRRANLGYWVRSRATRSGVATGPSGCSASGPSTRRIWFASRSWPRGTTGQVAASRSSQAPSKKARYANGCCSTACSTTP